MSAQILTTDDFKDFKTELLTEIRSTLTKSSNMSLEQKRFLRSSEVMELLGLSASTLQHLRIKKILPYSKLGGTFYYDWNDVISILEKNKKVAPTPVKTSLFKI